MNMGKLGQTKIAKAVGFNMAQTSVGATNAEVAAFVKMNIAKGSRICTKPLSQKYLEMNGELHTRYTEILPHEIDIEAEDFETCPIIFQNYIEKQYEIRVTVIDQEVIGVKIESQKAPPGTQIDWRKYDYPQTPHSEDEVPDDDHVRQAGVNSLVVTPSR